MKNIYQFIVKYNDMVMTVASESMEEAFESLQRTLAKERSHTIQFAGKFNADEFSKSLKLSTVLVEASPISSLDEMAEMLKDNGYKVKKV